MAIHFLDTPLQKALAFLPDFGRSALLHLYKDLKSETIAKTQQIYLHTLVDEYCAIGVAGSVFFMGMLIVIVTVNQNHARTTHAKLAYACSFVYTAWAIWVRRQAWEENRAALYELRGY